MPQFQAANLRKSNPFLTGPAPQQDQLLYMMQAAVRAPDHGNLSPYRFIIVQGAQLDKLGQLFLQASQAINPDLTAAEQQKILSRPHRAPMVIVSIARIQEKHPKIPEDEQLITAGLAVHQLMIAGKELGFDSMWRTGDLAYNPELMQLLNLLSNEKITGFIYIGTAAKDKANPPLKEADLFYSNLEELV